MARGLGGRYGLPWDGVLTWGQDFYGLNFLLVPKEEASELCHQLARMRPEGQSCQRPNIKQGHRVVHADALPGQVQSYCFCLCEP